MPFLYHFKFISTSFQVAEVTLTLRCSYPPIPQYKQPQTVVSAYDRLRYVFFQNYSSKSSFSGTIIGVNSSPKSPG
jgi:hypothetical protein